MYFSSRSRKEDHQVLEDNVTYPEASVKEYLNIRRTTKNKCCLVSFCISIFVTIMLMGIGFFYGNYTNIGIFVGLEGPVASNCTYLDQSLACVTTCTLPNQPYLQKICLPANQSFSFSSSLQSQIQIYNLKSTFSTMLYTNVGILVGIILCFLLLICYPKLLYAYILLTFLILLGFSFYLLKSIQQRVGYWNSNSVLSGVIINDETEMTSLAYILLAAYLFIFPIILFSPKKIQNAVGIIEKMEKYFEVMYTIILFTILVVIGAYSLLFLIGFLVMNFYTDGDPVIDSSSFFYLYQKVYLSHPVVLIVFFFGVYWLFGTLISWHKYLVGSSVLQWYFQDGGKLQPVRKGLKRAWYQLGSAAIDCLLGPLQWIILLLYSIVKIDGENAQGQQLEHTQDCLCCSNCIYSFRKMITKIYCKINRGAPSSGALTNQSYTESCQIAAVTFAQNKHKFFNIGGSLALYLTLFSMLIFVFINYLALYNTIYLASNPAPISSLALPVILAVSLGVVLGQLMSNLFTASLDCLLFCFLLEKKNGVEYSTNEIKKHLEELYNKEEEIEEVNEMYELQEE